MTCKINLLFFPYHNTGGHFVDWSLRFVCGHTDLDHQQQNQKNWHHYRAFKARGLSDLMQKIHMLERDTARQFENVYIESLGLSETVQILHGINVAQSSHAQRQEAQDHIRRDTQQMLQWAQQAHFVPVILDYNDADWYSQYYNNRNIINLEYQRLQDQQQVFDQYLEVFFPNTQEKFSQDTVWDRREMLALIWRFDPPISHSNLWCDCQLPYLLYNTDDIWNNFPAVLQEMCAVLGLQYVPERLENWKTIYQQWRLVQDPYFGRHLDRIIDAIVHNKYLSLRRFNMTFWHEVIIQNQLIHKHNLNLRTWQLEKFPDNTQDLHQLLEPNCHVL